MISTKIKLEVSDKLIDLLKILKIDNVTIDIELNKENTIAITNSEVEWDYANEEITKNDTKNYIPLLDNLEKVSEVVISPTFKTPTIETYNDLALLIEAIWRLGKENPNKKFEEVTDKIPETFVDVNSSILKIDHTLLRMMIEGHYKKKTIDEAKEDILNKMKSLWPNLKNYVTLNSLSIELSKLLKAK